MSKNRNYWFEYYKMIETHKLEAIDIQIRHHRLLLNYRSQDRIVQSDDFLEAWSRADEIQRKYVLRILSNPKPYEAKRWVAKMIKEGLDQYPIKILRQIASYHKIMNYSRMSRTQLLEALDKKGIADDSKDV